MGDLTKSDPFKTTLGWILLEENNIISMDSYLISCEEWLCLIDFFNHIIFSLLLAML